MNLNVDKKLCVASCGKNLSSKYSVILSSRLTWWQ